jgi:hypothetical protein
MTPTDGSPAGEPSRASGQWWIEVLLKLTLQHGIPMVVALILGGIILWWSNGVIASMAKEVSGTKIALEQHQQLMLLDAASAKEAREREIRILELLCQSMAKSDAMRIACGGGK